jgi:hypothetical protein
MSARARSAAAVVVAMGALGMTGLGLSLAGLQEVPFPHSEHQGLFPLCTGCHEGIPSGDIADWYPEPGSCDGCHDGVERARVLWDVPEDRIDNVRFEHGSHAEALEDEGDPEQECASCHIPEGSGRMFVSDSIQLETCWSCHQHETDDHFDVDQACESCHVPLAETAFSRERIEAISVPPSHDTELFISEEHGRLVPGRADRCATCHVQERCTSCHVDATLVEIVALPKAPPEMDVPLAVANYPEPASHGDEGWIDAHQTQASPSDCSTCHTTDDCRSCHVGIVPAIVEALPEARVWDFQRDRPKVTSPCSLWACTPRCLPATPGRVRPAMSKRSASRATTARLAAGIMRLISCLVTPRTPSGERLNVRTAIARSNFAGSVTSRPGSRASADSVPGITTVDRSGCFVMVRRLDRGSRAVRAATSRSIVRSATACWVRSGSARTV